MPYIESHLSCIPGR